ncbi:hypothetical protein ACS99_01930 [Lacticaseibacillus rhamnosus]|nr:hypothetical protein ACS99_01930 [Lacticaseibacillus rhamnosus]
MTRSAVKQKNANPTWVSFFRISILHEEKNRLIVAFKAHFINRSVLNSFVDRDSNQRQDT